MNVSFRENMASYINFASEQFQGPVPQITGGLQFLMHEKIKIFGVKLEDQTTLDFDKVKTSMRTQLKRPVNASIIQVVGDSLKFCEKGTSKAIDFLTNHIDENSSIVLYGYNGHGDETGCDANQVVNYWIDHDPSRARIVVANIVERTAHSIKGQDAAISTYTKNFFLVHKKGGSSYGDDIPLSDGLTEKIICLDGGAQTFYQLVNCLDKNVTIEGLYNLRGTNNPELLDEKGQHLNLFSAPDFLAKLKLKINESGFDLQTIPLETIMHFKEEYFSQHPPINPNKSGYEKKMSLLNKGWDLFVKNELWKRLDLTSFEEAKLT